MRALNQILKTAQRATPLVKQSVRRCSSSAQENIGSKSSMVQVPAWGLVVMGATAAGFFGKVLHDDNLETRRELGKLSDRLDGRIDRLDGKIDRLEAKVDAGFKELSERLPSPRPK